MNLVDLFKVDFYFKGALATIHLSGTTIISGVHSQRSSIFNDTQCVSFKQALSLIPFFIDIELIHKSSCNHSMNYPFSIIKEKLQPLIFCRTGIVSRRY